MCVSVNVSPLIMEMLCLPGVYMPPFGMIAGGILVKALALWYSTSCAAEQQEQEKVKKVSIHQ